MKRSVFSVTISFMVMLISLPSHAQISRLWMSKFDGMMATQEFLSDSKTDADGNLYLTGFTHGTSTSDFLTVKYDSNGLLLWSATKRGPSNLSNYAYAIVVDKWNNVLVTGMANYTPDISDAMTVKYNPQGEEVWTAIFDGSDHDMDVGYANTIDNEGNVYVCGETRIQGNSHALILKYDTGGTLLFSRTHKLPSKIYSLACAIQVDDSGNSYVAGYYSDSSDSYTGMLLKYTAQGNLEWSREFTRPEDPDVLLGHVDILGSHIFVEGRITETNSSHVLVAQFDTAGDTTWTREFCQEGAWNTFAYDFTVDSHANSYLTGSANSYVAFEEIVSASFDAAGNLRWVKTYNSVYDGNERGTAIRVEPDGNVYVAGMGTDSLKTGDMVIIKYDSAGNQVWARSINDSGNGYDVARRIDFSHFGKVLVSGNSHGLNTGQDFLSICLDKDGSESWQSRYSSTSSAPDRPLAMTVDDSGNTCVTGVTSSGANVNDDNIATVKFAKDGTNSWTAIYRGDSLNSYMDRPNAIAHDKENSVYVTGKSYDFRHGLAYMLTIKYGSDGQELWSRKFVGPGAGYENEGIHITVDDSGYVYVGGGAVWSTPNGDFAVIKYSPSGDQLWVAHYDGPNGQDEMFDMALDDSSNVYVTGLSSNENSFYDYATVRFRATDGRMDWVARYNGAFDREDAPRAMSLDGQGNVYVTGSSYDTLQSRRAITIKYDRQGQLQWIHKYPAQPGYLSDTFGWNIFVDDVGNAFVSVTQGYDRRFALLMIRPNGTTAWVADPSPMIFANIITRILKDKNDNIFISGYYAYSSISYPFIAKFNSAGTFQWVYYDSIAHAGNFADMRLTDNGDIIFARDAYFVNTGSDYVVERFSLGTTNIETGWKNIPTAWNLYNAYPNPFNPTTTLTYDVAKTGNVMLKIYDVLGREVATLVNEIKSPGSYSVQWNSTDKPSGIYFYRLSTSGYSITKKMVLMK